MADIPDNSPKGADGANEGEKPVPKMPPIEFGKRVTPSENDQPAPLPEEAKSVPSEAKMGIPADVKKSAPKKGTAEPESKKEETKVKDDGKFHMRSEVSKELKEKILRYKGKEIEEAAKAQKPTKLIKKLGKEYKELIRAQETFDQDVGITSRPEWFWSIKVTAKKEGKKLAEEERTRRQQLEKAYPDMQLVINSLQPAVDSYKEELKRQYVAMTGPLKDEVTAAAKKSQEMGYSSMKRAIADQTKGKESEVYDRLQEFAEQFKNLGIVVDLVGESLSGKRKYDDVTQQDIIDKISRRTPDLIVSFKTTLEQLNRYVELAKKDSLRDMDGDARKVSPKLSNLLKTMETPLKSAIEFTTKLDNKLSDNALKHVHPGSYELRDRLKASGHDVVGGKRH